MPKQEGQKTKLLALLHIFEQKTDENHLLNVPQLVELLEQQGILAERKSIYSDIDTLCALGYDIQLRRGRGGGYWMASRAFELSELKLLVDAVQASKVISARTSKKLIRKLEALCSEYEGTQLQRQVYVDGRPKADSRTLLYSIDALHTAISAGRLVQFRYKNNSTWTVSPWQLAWEGGCYYLIAYQDEKDPANIRNYRVDRMSYVKVLDRPRRGKEAFAAFDLPSYLRKHFNMFGGPEYRVTLRCTADLEAAMRDRFGQDTLFLPEADGYFHFDVPVCVSDQFYGWVCGFGGLVEKRHITFSGVFFQFPAKHHLPHHGLSVALCFPERLTGQAVRAVFLLDVLDGQPLDVGIVFKARPECIIQRFLIGSFHLGIKLRVAGVAVAAGGEQCQCHDTGQKNSRKTL